MRPFRLIDGVIVAAVALLGLKVLGLVAVGGRSERGEPSFGRVLSHARTNYVPGEPATTGSLSDAGKPEKAEAGVTPPGPATASLVPPSPSEKALLDRLGNRREELQQRQRELETREKLLQEQERRLDERLAKERGTEQARKEASAKGEGDPGALRGVITMYEAMKPKDAARVFDRLPLDVLVSVAAQMNSRKMSEVLAAMTPSTAERLTVALMKRAGGRAGDETPAASVLPGGELPAIEPRPTPADPGLSRR